MTKNIFYSSPIVSNDLSLDPAALLEPVRVWIQRDMADFHTAQKVQTFQWWCNEPWFQGSRQGRDGKKSKSLRKI